MSEDRSEYFVIGEVTGAHGHDGAVRATILTEFPERFKRGARLFIDDQPYTITNAKPSKETVILYLAGIDTIEAANLLRGKRLVIPASEGKVLPPGRYYHHEIIGLEVFTVAGLSLGKVSDILSTGANDVYVVVDGSKEILIPAVNDVVKEIDLGRKRLVIEVIEGLLD